MRRRFSVTAAALVALAGCGSSKPGPMQSPAAPSAPVTASPSATAATSPPASPPVPLENRIRLMTCRSSVHQAARVYSLIKP
jgi:predicted small lipoprotein YifL